MYRLVLYFLIGLNVTAVIIAYFQILPFSPLQLAVSILFLIGVSWITNRIFAAVFQVQANVESVYITALILSLIITPALTIHDFIFLAWAGILAMASKYILAKDKKHIFNPAAVAVAITAFAVNQSASWWIGNLSMMPFVVFGGLAVVRKIRREDMVFAFMFTAILVVGMTGIIRGNNLIPTVNAILLHSSLFFFAFVMLTEPLTTPPTKILQMVYGALVGFLFVPQMHLGNIYSTPELALLMGNVFFYLVSPKEKMVLKLKEKLQTGSDSADFIFPLSKKIFYIPGQYMEWTLSHKGTDDRGNRRYFTLASSPTEDNIRIGVKFYENGSSYKKALLSMERTKSIVASQRAGDFVLPRSGDEKLVFIAGGIGITPFRSILKYLIDKGEKRDIILFYSNSKASEIVYKDIFGVAEKELNLKVVYTLTDLDQIPKGWNGRTGRINEEMIKEEVPDFPNRKFYLSGPYTMVTGFEEVLKKIGVKKEMMKTDFFPGFV